jgi:hypothetical protein
VTDPFDAAAAAGHQLQQQLAETTQALAAETAQEQGDEAKIAALQKQVADLEAQINPAPAATTEFGMDVAAAGGITLDQAFTAHRGWTPGGGLPFVRLFSSGQPLTWTSPSAKLARTAEHPVFSFKTWDATL